MMNADSNPKPDGRKQLHLPTWRVTAETYNCQTQLDLDWPFWIIFVKLITVKLAASL